MAETAGDNFVAGAERPGAFTCIIPTHQREDLLEEALRSIAAQTLQPLEVIVSDNLCRAETRAVVEKVNSECPFAVTYLGHDQGGRGCISRNLAAERAKGEFLAFLDDDDLWAPTFLAEVARRFAETSADAVYTWTDYLLPDGTLVPAKALPEGLPLAGFVIRNPGAVISNLAVCRRVFLELRGFDEAMHPPYDRDFIMRLLLGGHRYAVVPQRLTQFRQHAGWRESLPGPSFAEGHRAFFQRYRDQVRPTLRARFWLKTRASAICTGVETPANPLLRLLPTADSLMQRVEARIRHIIG